QGPGRARGRRPDDEGEGWPISPLPSGRRPDAGRAPVDRPVRAFLGGPVRLPRRLPFGDDGQRAAPVNGAAPGAAAESRPLALLHLTRTFDAPRERVFRAWTDADAVRRWFGSSIGPAQRVEADLRVGGR